MCYLRVTLIYKDLLTGVAAAAAAAEKLYFNDAGHTMNHTTHKW